MAVPMNSIIFLMINQRKQKMQNWNNKLVRINLSDSSVNSEEIPTEIQEKYIGGRGLGVKYLYDELPAKIHPLSPENMVIFATGPITGTRTPLSGRYVVVSKSPLTGTILDSHSGGRFGTLLKYSGIDAFILTGEAEEWSYLSITPQGVEIHSAEDLIGLNTHETTDKIKKEFSGRTSVACIGPAGENQALLSCIINDKGRAAGRGGLGAVLGSKKLKAIIVSSDIQKTKTAQQEQVREDVLDLFKKNGVTKNGLPLFGTAVLVNIINAQGMFPTRNFQGGVFEDAEGISGEKILERFLVAKSPCEGCTIGCGRRTKLDSGRSGEGPEYETIWSFGAQCDINSIETIIEANYRCNEYGFDTISLGSTIGCAMELNDRGILSEDLEFGDEEKLLELIDNAAYQKDEFGTKISNGSYRLADAFGRPELSMSSKKLEFPAYDPRGAVGHGLAYATSNRGGCHLRAYLISPEILGSPIKVDRFDPTGKAEIVILMQNLSAFIDSLIMCKFTQFALSITDYARIYNVFTGHNISDEALLETGARIYNLERAFNNREGFTRKDDSLPPRFTDEPLPEGPSRDNTVPLEEMLDEYYKLRGWNSDGIVPQALLEK